MISGVNFLGRPEIHGQKFAVKLNEKFTGNFPKIRLAKINIHPESALQNLGLKMLGRRKTDTQRTPKGV